MRSLWNAHQTFEFDRACQADSVEYGLWPVGGMALSALLDLGLSDTKIAAYFGVSDAEVADLRRAYEL